MESSLLGPQVTSEKPNCVRVCVSLRNSRIASNSPKTKVNLGSQNRTCMQATAFTNHKT